MKNIILQHFDGKLGLLEQLSIENIKGYAQSVNADYKLLTVKVFRDHLTSPCQKVHMISEEFDNYDNVLMLDIDMFTPKNMVWDVFEVQGVGLHSDPVQVRLHQRLANSYPSIASLQSPYWGGAIYKMSRDLRVQLRAHLGGDESWMDNFNKRFEYEDEGIIHVLATKANIPLTNAYLDQKWCYCSYLPNPNTAGFIHIRNRVTPNGPHMPKVDVYYKLLADGVFK